MTALAAGLIYSLHVYLCTLQSELFLNFWSGLSRSKQLESLKNKEEVILGRVGFWVLLFESPRQAASCCLSALNVSAVCGFRVVYCYGYS